MKKSIKKITALLCVMLLLCSLAACSQKETVADRDFSLSTLSPVDPNNIPESAKEFSTVKPGTYTVLCHLAANGRLDATGEPVDMVDEEIFRRNAELKEKYSIDLKELTVTGNTADFVRNSTFSGLVSYDIASLTYRDALLLAASNSLCALSELGGYNQNRQMFSSSLSLGGKQYIETFDIFSPTSDGTYALAVNRRIFDRAGLADAVFSVTLQGGFTYEYLNRISSEKGTVSFSAEGLEALWAGGGFAFYENGIGDVPAFKKLGTGAESVYSALKQLHDGGILNDLTDYDSELDLPETDGFLQTAKNSLFTVGRIEQIEDAVRGGLELELLPMPKLSINEDYACYVSPESLCTVVPDGDEEKNSVAFALTGMLYEYDLDEPQKKQLTELISRDGAKTGEIVELVLSSRVFDAPAIYNIGGLYDFLGISLRNYLLPDAFVEGINDRAQTAVVAIEIMRESER